MKNKLFSFFVIAIVALGVGLFLGTKMVSPQLAPSTFSAEEQQGQVVLMGTPGIFPDKDPLLRTNYFSTSSGATSRIAYVQPDFTSITTVGTTNRACFNMVYLDRNKVVIPSSTIPTVATSLCVGISDTGMVLEALKITQGSPSTTGRAIVTAAQITQ